MNHTRALITTCCLWPAVAIAADVPKAVLVDVRRIWDKAPHNAFTDLVRFKDRWYCVFREGKGHVSPDGALRVITSKDGVQWASAAVITSDRSDLRDAKITVTPDGRLMLSGAEAVHPPAAYRHQSLTWFSADGRKWTRRYEVGDRDFWLWRTTWHKGRAYGFGYGTRNDNRSIRLYTSRTGMKFDTVVKSAFDKGYPNETSMVFLPDDTCYCLLRRDGKPSAAQLGIARPPYTKWIWKDLGVRIGGPHMIRLPDGRFVAAVRRYDGGARTALHWLDPKKATLTEFLKLPSRGDTSYAGLVWHDGLLWISYYSSHEGKTSIYLARVRFDGQPLRPLRPLRPLARKLLGASDEQLPVFEKGRKLDTPKLKAFLSSRHLTLPRPGGIPSCVCESPPATRAVACACTKNHHELAKRKERDYEPECN